MTTVDMFLDAIAQVESSDNPQAWGDGGRAMGRYQVHPDRLWFEAKRLKLEPKLGETWDQFVTRVLTALFQNWPYDEPRAIAMYWHLGHWVGEPGSADWDRAYDDKFSLAWARAVGRAIS